MKTLTSIFKDQTINNFLFNTVFVWLKRANNIEPTEINFDKKSLLIKLLEEEVKETTDALKAENVKEVVDGVIDILWILGNIIFFCGLWDMFNVMKEKVAESNFSKFVETEEQAIGEVALYKSGDHPYGKGRKVNCHYVSNTSGLFILLRNDGKILKPSNYIEV